MKLNFIDRIILGIKEKKLGIAFSGNITKNSKIITTRNIIERYKIDEHEFDTILKSEIEENDKILQVLETIAKKRGAILSGGRIDYEKISVILLDEFRSGKLGRITIEQCKKEKQ